MGGKCHRLRRPGNGSSLLQNAPVLSKELRRTGGYAYSRRWQKTEGKKGFETSITRLQEQCYVLISDFVYTVDKQGNRRGWGAESIIKRIDIAHPTPTPKIDPTDIAAQIEIVVKVFNKGRSTRKTAEKYGIDPALAEQIIRLYVTHPGVTTDGIMTKMGL